jgi:Putative zincin peptidase
MKSLPADLMALEQMGYRLDEKLTHTDLVPFVVRYLKVRTVFTTSFWVLNVLFLLLLIACCTYAAMNTDMTTGAIFSWISYGCFATFLLIPFHEGLHGLAYKMVGAPSVTYEAHWRKLYFTANADKFVIRRKPFYLVGLLPFVVISAVLLLATLFVSVSVGILLLTTLTLHAGMCAGDFGLLSYFAYRKEAEVISYDDMDNGISYFLVR